MKGINERFMKENEMYYTSVGMFQREKESRIRKSFLVQVLSVC